MKNIELRGQRAELIKVQRQSLTLHKKKDVL
jgi:hypothetical protein